MTDAERNALFDAKKKEIMDELLGTDASYPVPEMVTERYIDENWKSGKAFYDDARVLNPMNRDMPGMFEFNDAMRQNGGVTYTKSEAPLEAEMAIVH